LAAGPPEETPIEAEIVLRAGSVLIFKSIQGDFELHGGEVARFRWEGGVIYLNEKRFHPAHSQAEYKRWRGPYRKQELTLYQSVPFIQDRVSLYGDTDEGWNRAFSEWDSLKSWMTSEVTEYRQQHEQDQCRELMLSLDRHGLLEWVEVSPSGLEAQWRGMSSPETLHLLEFPPPSPRDVPSPATRREAESTLSMLRRYLEQDSGRLEVMFGSLRWEPGAARRREGGN
jgi:hypothetical protein